MDATNSVVPAGPEQTASPTAGTVDAPRVSATPPKARLAGLDAARGFALLGILLVNMDLFSEAFGLYMSNEPRAGSTTLDVIAYHFVRVFCEGKFYPLFSTLFGVGLAIQYARARKSGKSFLAPGLRRMAILGVLGLAHGLLLWYGDILFLYSTIGVVALALIALRTRPQILLGIAASMITLAICVTAVVSAFVAPTEESRAAAAAITSPLPPESPPYERLSAAMQANLGQPVTPDIPLWIETEREAYAEGPYGQALRFRIWSFVMYMVFCVFGFWWHIAAMALIGVAALQLGLFTPERLYWHRRLVILGAVIGLPTAILATVAPNVVPGRVGYALEMPLLMIGGPLMALAYLSGVWLLVQKGRLAPVTNVLAKAGRMALSCYLLETLAATFVFYHYGLGLFGTVGHAGRIGIAVGIYAVILGVSALWLRFSAYGPMEYLWRMVTYLRVPR